MMSSMPSPSTGIRLKPAASAASSASCTVASSSTVTMSGRGVITSRATVSPKSMMEWMKLRSSFSITFSSWATSAMALSSESVMNEWVSSWPPSSPAPMMRLASPLRSRESHRMGGNRISVLTNGALSSAARSGLMHGPVLRDRLEEDEDHHDFEDDAEHDAPGHRRRPRPRCRPVWPTPAGRPAPATGSG